jgi:hypothetical protein
MVMITVNIPNDLNKMVEHFKVEYELKDKRDAIVMLLKKCVREQEAEGMQELFAQVNSLKQINISPAGLARMKRETYSK